MGGGLRAGEEGIASATSFSSSELSTLALFLFRAVVTPKYREGVVERSGREEVCDARGRMARADDEAPRESDSTSSSAFFLSFFCLSCSE